MRQYLNKLFFSIISWATLALISFIVTSCMPAQTTSEGQDWYGVDPIFREYYRYLGGYQVLGPAISAPFQEGVTKTQYLETGKLVYDPTTSPRERFRLAPLGREMGLNEPPLAPASSLSPYSYNGHTVYPDFIPLYEKLGALNVGYPISEMRFNPDRRRYEQYFENLGFYRLEGSNEVHLLAFGVWACGEYCNLQRVDASAIMDLHQRTDATFMPLVSYLGVDFTGFPLTAAYVNKDGKWEQIFEKVVLLADTPYDCNSATLKTLARDLRIPNETPRPYTNTAAMYFYSLDGDRGYEIPPYFWDYLASKGGLAISGMPVGHLSGQNHPVYRQCFLNLCLLYDQSSQSVQVEPLGYSYRKIFFSQQIESYGLPSQPTKTVIQIWERHPVLSSSQSQELGINVLENNLPALGVIPYMKLTLPDGNQYTITLPETNAEGATNILIPPIPAPNGSLVLYNVCLPQRSGEEVCASDSYIIWNNP